LKRRRDFGIFANIVKRDFSILLDGENGSKNLGGENGAYRLVRRCHFRAGRKYSN